MKKTILLSSIFLASVLVGCEQRYESKFQARKACYEWLEMKPNIRNCYVEKETNQYLGRRKIKVDGITQDYEVEKHFRWKASL